MVDLFEQIENIKGYLKKKIHLKKFIYISLTDNIWNLLPERLTIFWQKHKRSDVSAHIRRNSVPLFSTNDFLIL